MKTELLTNLGSRRRRWCFCGVPLGFLAVFASLREPQRGEMKEENESSVSTFCCFCSLFCSVLCWFYFSLVGPLRR
jgi:bacteriorhodopsin